MISIGEVNLVTVKEGKRTLRMRDLSVGQNARLRHSGVTSKSGISGSLRFEDEFRMKELDVELDEHSVMEGARLAREFFSAAAVTIFKSNLLL